MSRLKFYVEGVGMRFGEREALFYTLAELKRLIKAQYPGKNARIWIESGTGMATTVLERWEKLWYRKNFRRVDSWR